jgi:beta-mannosidase
VRFAAECLAFATPPEPGTVEQACGGAARAGHHPLWKAAVYRDAGASWDFEDVRDHYTRALFGVEPSRVRWTDPERALDLGRATVAHLFEATWSEWRRAASTCAGALVFHYRDLAPGAGLGVVDALGRPKAPWYVMRRVLAPVAVLITDEGLNGLDAHVYNDRPEPLDAVLRVELFAPSGLRTESVQTDVSVPGHASAVVDLSGLFEGFRDLSYAHLFGPPAHDVLTATLCPRDESSDTGELGQAVFLVGGQARAVEQDLGLTAELSPVDTTNDSGAWRVTVRTRRFAQWVNLDIDGFIPADNWFHLAPESSRTIGLTASGDRPAPRGRVGALNVAASRSMSLVREA